MGHRSVHPCPACVGPPSPLSRPAISNPAADGATRCRGRGQQTCARGGAPPRRAHACPPVRDPQRGAPLPRRHAGWCAHAVGTWVGPTCGCVSVCRWWKASRRAARAGSLGGQLRAVAARAEGDILSRIATRPRPKHAAAIDRRAYPNSRRRRSCPPAPPKLPALQPKLPARYSFYRDPEGMRGTFCDHKNLHVRVKFARPRRTNERTNEAARRCRSFPPRRRSCYCVCFV